MTGDFTASSALGDAFLSLGGAAAVSLLYQLAFFSPPRSKWLNLAAHAVFFIPVGVAAFCFVAGATAARSPRWYIFAGAAAGVAAYIKCFSGGVARLQRAVRRRLRSLLAPLGALCARAARRLQKPLNAVYNRAVKRRAERTKKRRGRNGDHSEGEGKAKQPRKPYAQT